MGLNGFIGSYIFKGTLNAEIFKSYVESKLVRKMKKGDILILDNLSVHKAKDVLKALIDKGVQIMYLPPYSSDFNPIELAFSKLKNNFHRRKRRANESMHNVIMKSLKSISTTDILNYFKHCGYMPI